MFQPCTRLGGCSQHQIAQDVGNGVQLLAEGVVILRVSGTELRDFCFGSAFAGEQITAVLGGQEIQRAPLDDFQAVRGADRDRGSLSD